MNSKYSIDVLISERLKLPTVQRKIGKLFNKEIKTTKDLFSPKIKTIILKFTSSEFSDFVITIAGKINKQEATNYLHENTL